MNDRPYMVAQHHFHKALADVKWPCTKKDVLDAVGDRVVPVDWDVKKSMKELIEPIEKEEYESAAEFYNAYFASLY